MEAWMAFVSIMAIVAVVLVGGGIIAFIAHLIIGALDRTDKTVNYEAGKTELLDYATYKQNQEKPSKQSDEYDFEAINKAKVEEEKSLLEEENDANFEIDEELVEKEEIAEEIEEQKVENKVEELDDDDDLDFDAMLEEISNDIIEEEKEKSNEENAPKMSDELGSYSIEEYLNSLNEEVVEEEKVEETAEVVEETAENNVEDVVESVVETEEVKAESTEEDEDSEESLEIKPEVEEVVESEVQDDVVEEKVEEEKVDESKQIIEDLKAQLADLNKQLEEARSSKTEVVTINMTEEECVARLEMLEERLKDVKKDYKTNMKEYRPLKKVMNDLEKYQTKLRRKDTIVAKKKVALYGVNNYVDIDKEKAEKLANDLELLEGLRLSVSHCEEVINANKERYPILERTNQILEDQIAHIEADIASTQATLNKIREQNGEGENK